MLEKIDLSKKLPKTEYKEIIGNLELKIAELQREARESKIPVIILFEGWDAAGKGTMINRLILSLDPRGFTVHPINPPNEEERLRPFLWRFWTKTPEKGRIALFDRSWYGRVLVARVDRLVKKKDWSKAYDEIKSFERQLADNGCVIIKFFLHIDKKEQKKRFKNLQKNSATAWKVTKDDWRHHEQYEKYAAATEDMLAKTDTEFAPWTIVEAHDRRFSIVKIITTIVDALERKIQEKKLAASSQSQLQQPSAPQQNLPDATVNFSSSILDKVDLSVSISRSEYENSLKKYQSRILELEHEVFRNRMPVIIVYEGWDAAGKGGNIKRLVQGMDPRGYEVIPIAAPNDIELAHHYLWRFWTKIPKAGHIAIFDRSWYGRVLVERVEGFCCETEWKRSFREINEMEQHLVNFGTVLLKFWIQIDKDEQLRRFESRQQIEYKKWKITQEDWRNREKWDAYKTAIDEMLFKTSTAYAPWTIVESNCKWCARTKALKTVVEKLEERM